MTKLRKILSFRNLLKIASIGATIFLTLSYLSPVVHPQSIGFIPFFGLAYPFIIIAFLLLNVIWIFLNYRWAIAMGIILILGGNLHFRTFTIGGGDDPKGAPSLKVMSYNVHLFGRYNPDVKEGLSTRNKILSYLKETDPGVLCFQEFYHQDRPTDFVTRDSLVKLIDFKDHHERYMYKRYGRQNFGIAIFSKYPMIEKGDLNFASTELPTYNYCIYADIVVKKDTFRVYNLHLQSIRLQENDYAVFEENGAENESSGLFTVLGKVKNAFPVRAKQAEVVMEHIKNAPYPVIVCGDFNDTPMSYTYNQFNTLLTDAFRNTSFGFGKTYAGTIPAGRIDYIFHSQELGSYDFQIQKEKLSDHYAINCSIFRKKE